MQEDYNGDLRAAIIIFLELHEKFGWNNSVRIWMTKEDGVEWFAFSEIVARVDHVAPWFDYHDGLLHKNLMFHVSQFAFINSGYLHKMLQQTDF